MTFSYKFGKICMEVVKVELVKNLKFAYKYAKGKKGLLILYLICNIISIAVSIVIPIVSAKMVVALTSNVIYELICMAVVMYLVETVNSVVNYISRYCSQVIYRESFTKLQIELGSEILKLKNSCIDKNGSGVFIQRITNDTSRLADIFNVLNRYAGNVLANIGVLVAIFLISKVVFVYYIIVLIALYFIIMIRNEKYNENDKILRKKNDKISGFIGEIIRGARDVKMLNSEKDFIEELDTGINDLNNARYKMQKTDNKYDILQAFTIDLSDFLLIIILVILITKSNLMVASAIILKNYSWRVTTIIDYYSMLVEKVKDFNLSASRIFSIINSSEFEKETFGTKHLDKVEGNFEFKNVSFKYDDEEEYVLKNLSFKVRANETVAFVGKSGAGKSTIFSLLCKMYDVNKGKITIDGININELDKDSIRGNITIISQNPYIFNLSIRDNLRLVKKDLTEEEMINACHLACLDDFIDSLPNGYDTIIGEGGVNLSGGQKQRLAIARALVQKTEIILFDEATSALDNETQSKIQKAINNMKNEYTILIIAHRLSTVKDADRILFLENGKILAEGTHKELLKTSKEYKNLYKSEM
jgi:ABC-type multidrug transport system fused ATPase/permease subunit